MAGGLPPRRIDQRSLPLTAIPPPPAAPLINPVIIITPGRGLYVYNGQPRLGNPPVLWAGTGSTDPYGNPVTPALGLNGLPFLAYGLLASGGVVQTILTGSGTFNVPAGVSTLQVLCTGPAGNGGSGTASVSSGGGGGGGESASEPFLAVTPSGTCAYSAGAGGSGNPTTFAGNTVTVTAHAGHNGGTGVAPGGGPGGTGGTGSTNTQHHNGGAGGGGTLFGGGGGGSGGYLLAGNPGQGPNNGDSGGAAVSGGGGGGNGGNGTTGFPGTAPGGGGGGGSATSGQTAGGAGASGRIVVTYTTSSAGTAILESLSATGGIDGLTGQIYPPGFCLPNYALVLPSGDTSGVTDGFNINTALGFYKKVALLPGTFWTNVMLNIPSGGALGGLIPWQADSSSNYGAGALTLGGSLIVAAGAFTGGHPGRPYGHL
jgi:hypothetical protein